MWLVVCLFLLIAKPINAALCVEDNILKCQELGYTESSCPYGGIACQYDPSLWYCAKWTCRDGRYYSASDKPTNAECIEVTYKNLTCYDCQYVCPIGQIDFSTCWNGLLNTIVKDSSTCASLGYIDNATDCTNYIACPSDTTKVRCLNK